MSNVFIVSDTHFSHANICKFRDVFGQKVRPWDDVAAMDEALVERWNAVVKPTDKVYHLGDVAVPRRGLALVERCHGRKVLVMGNHDIFPTADYLKPGRFYRLHAAAILADMLLTHIPVRLESADRWSVNVHGHMHGMAINDSRYLNVCVERTDYQPVELSQVLALVAAARDRTARKIPLHNTYP